MANTIIANPGNMVVPLSAIIDQLQGKLSAADLNALLLAVVGQKKSEVRPGDLITADLVNQILSDLEDLNIRISKIESSGTSIGAVRIDGFNVTQPLHVGDPIEVDGAGFLVPAVLNQVTMGGVTVSNFAMMSSATKLFFQVPAISVPPSGSPVTVTVTNANGSATSPTILVLPAAVIAKGQTQLAYAVPPVMPVTQPNITAGQPYTFTFNIKFVPAVDNSAANATYTLTPTISGSGWSATLLDAGPIVAAPNTNLPLHIQVTAGTGVGVLSLQAVETSTGTQVAPGSFQLSITQNNPPPTPENRVRVAFNQAGGGAQILGGTVQFTRNQSGGIQFTLMFTEQGDYSVNPVMRSATGWKLDSLDLPSFHVNQPSTGTTANQDVNVWFTAGSGAASTDLLFTVTRPSDGLTVTYSLPVTVVG